MVSRPGPPGLEDCINAYKGIGYGKGRDKARCSVLVISAIVPVIPRGRKWQVVKRCKSAKILLRGGRKNQKRMGTGKKVNGKQNRYRCMSVSRRFSAFGVGHISMMDFTFLCNWLRSSSSSPCLMGMPGPSEDEGASCDSEVVRGNGRSRRTGRVRASEAEPTLLALAV